MIISLVISYIKFVCSYLLLKIEVFFVGFGGGGGVVILF